MDIEKNNPVLGDNLIVANIKKIIIDLIYYSEEPLKFNLSDYITEKIGYHYTYVANLFSKKTGSTVTDFYIQMKIERVKELIIDGNLTLTEISYKLNYSSLAHLSNQFKKITGMNFREFKHNQINNKIINNIVLNNS